MSPLTRPHLLSVRSSDEAVTKRSEGCALLPTNGAAPPPAQACLQESNEGEGSEGEEEEDTEVCSPHPPPLPLHAPLYLSPMPLSPPRPPFPPPPLSSNLNLGP